MFETLRSRAICGMFGVSLLYANDEVREATSRSGVRASAFRISSVSPSANHVWSPSGLKSANGRTAIDFSVAAAAAGSAQLLNLVSCVPLVGPVLYGVLAPSYIVEGRDDRWRHCD